MIQFRSLGWALLVGAFLAAAAESAAQAMTRDWGVMAASDVLRALYPNFFEALRDAIVPFAWDFIALPLLALPGWLLMGAPGAALVWHFRAEGDNPIEASDADYPQTTYEDIVAAAHEADEQDIGLPSKYRDLDEYDPTNPPTDENSEPALDPYDLERADIVPPARYIAPPARGDGRNSPKH